MAGPLVNAYNASLARLSELTKIIDANEKAHAELLDEQDRLRADLEQMRQVFAHIVHAPPVAEGTVSRERPARKRPIRESSSVGWSRRVLQQAGKPLHIDVLLNLAEHMSGQRISKATLVSNLSRYVNAHDTFSRPEPNTYALLEDAGTDGGQIRLVG